MDFVHLEHFAIVGITARTSNLRENTPEGSIGKLWERFLKESVAAQIPDKADSNVVAFYSNYASDEHGDYDFLIGAKVNSVSALPDGMVMRNAPTSRFAVFRAGAGPPPKVVPELWRRIWEEPRTAKYTRSYRGDFELYKPDGAVEIYIAVKD